MPKRHFLRGLRDGFPIGLGYFAVSFGIGISCRAANLTAFQGFLVSFLNNASAGEYGGITIIASDSGFLIMAAMMLVVNARYMLMSCALSQHLSPDTPLIFRLIIGYDRRTSFSASPSRSRGYLNVWLLLSARVCGHALLERRHRHRRAARKSHAGMGGQRIFCHALRHVHRHHRPHGQARPRCARLHHRELSSRLARKRPAVLRELSEGTRILILTIVISAAAAVLFPQEEETIEGEAVEEEVRGV